MISTIGTMPNPSISALELPIERGRIVVNPDLSAARRPGVRALGDCALAVNAQDGAPCPPTAQFAVRQGRHATITASLTGAGSIRGAPGTASRAQPPAKPQGKNDRTFSYRERGSLATVGHLNGVARVFGLSLTGLPAWLLWRAYYLSQMPTFGRKPRIFVEWNGACSSTRTSPISVLRAARTPERTGRRDFRALPFPSQSSIMLYGLIDRRRVQTPS